jgi:hypothetical protein
MTAPFHRDSFIRVREAPQHAAVVPPGMAYAAREANRALEVRKAREAEILQRGRDEGAQS